MLQIKNLNIIYGDKQVLTNVSFSLKNNQIVALLGVNGVGKSSLLTHISGIRTNLKSDLPVFLDGRKISSYAPDALAVKRAMLQQHNIVNFDLKVIEVLQIALENLNLSTIEKQSLILEVASLLRIKQLLIQSYLNLSGGQKQMVQMARVILQIYHPHHTKLRYLFLDEPFNSLDLKNSVILCEVLQQLTRVRNIAILFTSHDLNLAINLSNRILILAENLLAVDASPEQALTNANIYQYFGARLERIFHKGKYVLL